MSRDAPLERFSPGAHGSEPAMFPNRLGGWVRFSDCQQAIAAKDRKLAELRRAEEREREAKHRAQSAEQDATRAEGLLAAKDERIAELEDRPVSIRHRALVTALRIFMENDVIGQGPHIRIPEPGVTKLQAILGIAEKEARESGEDA